MYEALYRENRGLLRHLARRYAGACARDRAVSVEDLEQAGFFGLVRAAETYDPDGGKSWAGWAAWHIAREIHNALGYRGAQPTKAHTGALPLDAPLNRDDPEGETALDALPDETLPDMDAALNLDNMRRYVRSAVERLEDARQRAVIRLCALEGQPYEAAAGALGVTVERVRQIREAALRKLRQDRRLRRDARADLDERTPFYLHVGVEAFNATQTSATERAVLWRIEEETRLRSIAERADAIERALDEQERLFRENSGITGKGASPC